MRPPSTAQKTTIMNAAISATTRAGRTGGRAGRRVGGVEREGRPSGLAAEGPVGADGGACICAAGSKGSRKDSWRIPAGVRFGLRAGSGEKAAASGR